MPNVRVSEATLRMLRHLKALMTLEDGREHSLDEVLQGVLKGVLDKLTLREPEDVRRYADLLEKLKQARRPARRIPPSSSSAPPATP